METHAPVLARAGKNLALCIWELGEKSAGKATFPLKRHEWLNRRPRGLYSLALTYTDIFALSVRRLFISATKDTLTKQKTPEPKFELPLRPSWKQLHSHACKYFLDQIEISLYQYKGWFFFFIAHWLWMMTLSCERPRCIVRTRKLAAPGKSFLHHKSFGTGTNGRRGRGLSGMLRSDKKIIHTHTATFYCLNLRSLFRGRLNYCWHAPRMGSGEFSFLWLCDLHLLLSTAAQLILYVFFTCVIIFLCLGNFIFVIPFWHCWAVGHHLLLKVLYYMTVSLCSSN